MAQDDWRLRIVLDEHGSGLLERLAGGDARKLERELEDDRLAVSHDENVVFVYAATAGQLDRALPTIEAELAELGLEPLELVREHWLDDEDRWDTEPPHETIEEETIAAGYAPWEVRVPCRSHGEARELADRLEAEGYGVVRRWSYVIVGTSSKEEAEELAGRLHGEVEAGGELVWETAPKNPFAVFGGLSG
jgi:hypothetical protein